MKRFAFRLQRVLDLRARIRDERRQELVIRRAEYERQMVILLDLEREISRDLVDATGTHCAGKFLLAGAYVARLRAQRIEQQARVNAAEKVMEQARTLYIEASRDAQALERLKERRKVEHLEASLREEGQMLDEVAVQRSGRRDE
jgi:flagellar FliJ protein